MTDDSNHGLVSLNWSLSLTCIFREVGEGHTNNGRYAWGWQQHNKKPSKRGFLSHFLLDISLFPFRLSLSLSHSLFFTRKKTQIELLRQRMELYTQCLSGQDLDMSKYKLEKYLLKTLLNSKRHYIQETPTAAVVRYKCLN